MSSDWKKTLHCSDGLQMSCKHAMSAQCLHKMQMLQLYSYKMNSIWMSTWHVFFMSIKRSFEVFHFMFTVARAMQISCDKHDVAVSVPVIRRFKVCNKMSLSRWKLGNDKFRGIFIMFNGACMFLSDCKCSTIKLTGFISVEYHQEVVKCCRLHWPISSITTHECLTLDGPCSNFCLAGSMWDSYFV